MSRKGRRALMLADRCWNAITRQELDKELCGRPNEHDVELEKAREARSPLGTACDERLGTAQGLSSCARLSGRQLLSHRATAVVICQQPTANTHLASPDACRVSASNPQLPYRLSHLPRHPLSSASTAVAHISLTLYTQIPHNMSARQQQMGRPGGARFAQFKLVLLGMPDLLSDAPRICMLTMLSQANPPSERCATTYQTSPRTRRLTNSRVRSSSASSRISSTTTGNPPSALLSSPKRSLLMTQPLSSSRSGIPQVKNATSPWLPCTTATQTALS